MLTNTSRYTQIPRNTLYIYVLFQADTFKDNKLKIDRRGIYKEKN